MRSDSPDPDGLDRWLAGEAGDEEREAIEAMLRDNPRLARLARMIREGATLPGTESDTDTAWRTLAARLDLPERAQPDVIAIHSRPARATVPEWTRRAAVLTGAVVLGGLLVWRLFGGVASSADLIAGTGIGETRTLRLADGSEVMLAPESRLLATAPNERTYRLDGEALFRVRHDAASPFRVRAQGGRVDVLGTVFTVRARAGEDLRVAVTEGRVALRADAQADGAATLTAGQVGSISAGGFVAVLDADDVNRFAAWTDGRLIFEEESARVIADEIERWFDVEIRIPSESLAARRLTARFRADELSEVLDAMALTLNAAWTRDGRVVVLVPR